MRRSVLLVALFACTAVPAFAEEPAASTTATSESGGSAFKQPGGMFDASEQPRPFMIGAFIEFPYGYWWGGFPIAIGGRFYIPLVKQGFVPSLNDEFGLDVGADLALLFGYFSGVNVLIDIPVEAMWKLNLTSKFSAYAKLGVGLGLRFGAWFSGGCGYSCWPVAPTFYGGVGAIYKLTEGLWLRGEIGYPGLKIGLTFPL